VGLLCSEFLELYYRVIKEEQSLSAFPDERRKKPGDTRVGPRVIIFSAATVSRCAAAFRRLFVALRGRLAFRRLFAVMRCALCWLFTAVLLPVLIVAVMLLACDRFPGGGGDYRRQTP
jgi:hypothetical protein